MMVSIYHVWLVEERDILLVQLLINDGVNQKMLELLAFVDQQEQQLLGYVCLCVCVFVYNVCVCVCVFGLYYSVK